MTGAATIGVLNVKLGLDSAQFDAGLKSAQSKLAGFGKAVGLSVAAIGVAAAGVGIAVAAGVKGAINAFDELSKTSQKVGVAVEQLSKLQYAASLADVSNEQLATGLKKLAKNMADVAGGNGAAAGDAFRALGISVTDASGRLKDSDKVLEEIAGKFAGLKDGAGKTALAMAIFGKSGADLIPLLNAGATGLKEMADEAAALGIVIDQKTATSAENFNDNLTRLHAAASGITTQLAAGMLPALEGVTNAMVGTAKNAAALAVVGKTLGATLQVLATVAVGVGGAVATAGYALFGTFGGALKLMQGDIAGAQKALTFGGQGMVKTISGSAKMIKDIWVGTGAAVAAAAPAVSDQIAAPIAQGVKKVKKETDKLAEEAKRAQKAAQDYVAALRLEVENFGLSSDQVKVKELQAKAEELLAKGFLAEAAAVVVLTDRLIALQAIKKRDIDLTVDMIETTKSMADAAKDLAVDAKSPIEQVEDGFYDISRSVDDVFYGIANNDWVGAFAGLTRALEQVQKAFGATGTAADKFTAIAGVANGIGGAIGGKTGGAISGAASGALAGFTLGGPVGAAIGGIIGGLGGLFGASKAKKQAKKQAAEQAAAQAAQKAAEEAAAKEALLLQIMELSGDAAGAQAKQEQALLDTLSPANQELQKQVFALQKEAQAKADAEALVAQMRDLQIEKLEALGDIEGATALIRQEALEGLTGEALELKKSIFAVIDATAARQKAEQDWADKLSVAQDAVTDARNAAADAYEREGSALRDFRDRMKGLADSLAEVRKNLKAGELSGVNPLKQAAAARAALSRTSALAAAGNEQALADLPAAIQDFVATNKAVAPNSRTLDGILAQARKAAADGEAVARAQVSSADAQLSALEQSVAAELQIRDATLSVADAMKNLSAAVLASNELQAQANASLAGMAASVAPAVSGLTTAINDNTAIAPVPVVAFDPAAATAALDAAAPGLPSEDVDAIAEAVHAALGPALQQLIISSRGTYELLDDVTAGGNTLRTQAA